MRTVMALTLGMMMVTTMAIGQAPLAPGISLLLHSAPGQTVPVPAEASRRGSCT